MSYFLLPYAVSNAISDHLIISWLINVVLLFVFWYCHKRGRETRLEKERLAAEEGDSALASSASSFTDDGDSIFSPQESKPKKGGKAEKPDPPLIIHDDKEADKPSATVDDMPSVLHLPDPKTVPLPEPAGDTPAKEEPLKVPGSK